MTATDDLKKAIALVEQAANILQKSQMAFDFTVSNPHAHDHHVAYTRTNASGTVSNIKAKGAPHPLQAEADKHRAEAARYDAEAKEHEKGASPKKPKKTEKPLPTNNEGYGYHGEAYTAHEGHVQYQEQGAGADTHFAEAAKHVMKYGGVGAEDARNYLDSRYGRHLHDEVQNFTSQHVGRPKDVEKGHHPDTIKKYIGPAIKEHFQRKYSQRLLSDVVKNRESFK